MFWKKSSISKNAKKATLFVAPRLFETIENGNYASGRFAIDEPWIA
jgi:hypothetical protein